MDIGPKIVVMFGDSGIFITETVINAIGVAIVLIILAKWSTSRMEKIPKGKQFWAEMLVSGIYKLVEDTMGKKASGYAPYIGTLFLFLVLGSMLGMLHERPMTADVNMTFAVAIITFVLIQRQAIVSHGVKGKLKEMCDPYPFMFPLKIIEQISFPVSLAFRLFGNILAGFIVIELLFEGLHAGSDMLGLTIPIFQAVIPLPANLFFDVFEPVLQSFIFVMLTMVFISIEMAVAPGHEDSH